MIPLKFRKSSDKIVSYSFNDIIDGTGYKTFYAVDLMSGAVIDYQLTSNAYDGDAGYTEMDASGTGMLKEFNFDVKFDQPKRINGDIIVNATHGVYTNGNDVSIQPRVRIYHVGTTGTETEIGLQQSGAVLFKTTAGDRIGHRGCYKFPNVQRNFKSNEKLRLNIEIHGVPSGGVQTNAYLFHDGGNKDFGYDLDYGTSVTAPTSLKIDVPFDLQL